MRAYTAATAAFTLRVPVKWVDNVLSHHHVAGVSKSRQGIPRRLSLEAIVTIAVGIRLSERLEAPMAKCLTIASSLDNEGHYQPDSLVALHVDVEAIRAEVTERLQHAVETVPIPRRGRRPG